MGEADTGTISNRKRREKSEIENPDVSPEKKPKTFCCRTFRRELKGSETLKTLKRFISAAKASDDVVYDYLECGGSIQEILSVIDATATGDLTTALPVFEVVHLILLRFQSADSKHHEKCIESARTILRSHLYVIKTMLAMNVTKQKKVALKVLTAIATLDSSFANEIMNVIALSPTLITDLIQPSPEKESVRKCFILFVLSFLVEGNLTVVKTLLDKKGFLGSIIPGLKFDDPSTVNLTLSLLEEKILKNIKIPKTLKLKVFNTQIIKSLFDLYDWKGSQGIKQIAPRLKNKVKEVQINQNEKEMVVDSVHSFLLLLCCSQKYGIAFYDKSFGTSEQLNNQLLLTVFETLSDPLKNRKVAEVILKTIASCPDLMKPVLSKLEPSFQPRDSKNWFHAIDFAEDLIKTLDASTMLKNETEPATSNFVIKVGKTLCAPVVFLRVSKTGSQKSQPLKIRLSSLTLMTVIWKEIQKLFVLFQNFKTELSKSLYKHIFKFLPDAEDLVELWHNLCNTEFFASLPFTQEKKISFLSAVLECLHIIIKCSTDNVSSPLILADDLLLHLENIKQSISEDIFGDIQVKIVQFVAMDLEALTPSSELFEKSLFILLQSCDDSSISYLGKILTSLNLFRGRKREVDVWLLSFMGVPRENRLAVAKYFYRSVQNSFQDDNLDYSMNESSNGETYIQDQLISPLIFKCIDTLKSNSSKSAKKDQKIAPFRNFLCDLIIHLQHFYTVDVYLSDYLKDYSEVLNKPVLNYLKSWKKNCLKAPDSGVISCSLEQNLISWLASTERKDLPNFKSNGDINLLKLYSLFRLVNAYLAVKITENALSQEDVEKFSQILLSLLFDVNEDDRENLDLIAFDLRNKSVYQRHCLECLLRSKHLLNGFDVFQKKDKTVTMIISKVIIDKDIVKSLEVKKMLTEQWKQKFLKQLKIKLKKNKEIGDVEILSNFLSFFEYEHSEVVEMVELISSADLNLFMNDSLPSSWVMVFSKFVSMYCEKEELNKVVVRKLCDIKKYLNEKECSDQDSVDLCLEFLIKTRPSHLLLIDNDFIDVVVFSKSVTEGTVTLGKLLINDPSKVKYFFKLIKKNLESVHDPKILLSMLSSLIVPENLFLNAIKPEVPSLVWTASEINETNAPDLYNLLEMIYKRYEKSIVKTIAEGKCDVWKESSLTSVILRHFLDKKQINKLGKDLTKGNFNPELLFEVIKKKNDLAEPFLQGLLVFFSRLIKTSNEEDEIPWRKYSCIVSEILALKKDSSWESLTGSQEWKEFSKLALGFCLSSTKHSELVKILRLLISAFYKAQEESTDCGFIFQMVISHSQFLKVILSNTPLKSELVSLFSSLIERNSSELSPKHFPILLASYNASLSFCDRILLKIVRFYEKSGVAVSDYEPFVWGSSAVSHYSIGTSPGLSLWQRFNMGNVLDLLDGQKLEHSLKDFPNHRSLEANLTDIEDCDPNVYDPAFLLPLFTNLLSPGSVVFCLSFIYKGGLAYTVRSLSSEHKDVRLIASVVLSRFYNHLELSQNLKQKLVWMHFINCIRFGVKDLGVRPLPNLTTLFFARMTLELSRQPAEMYLPLQNFLLAKPYFGFDSVPEFLPLFHSSDVSYWKHRVWLLEVMRDGTKTASDMKLIFHSMSLKVIFCFFHSQLCDNESKKLILQVVEKMLHVDKSLLLISEYGLLNWINSIDFANSQPILHDLLNLLLKLTDVLVADIQNNKSELSSVCHIVQQGKFNWFRVNQSKVSDLTEAGKFLLGEKFDCSKLANLPFYFRHFEEENEFENLKCCIFIFNKLANKQFNDGNKK